MKNSRHYDIYSISQCQIIKILASNVRVKRDIVEKATQRFTNQVGSSSPAYLAHLLELDVDIPLTESLFEVLLCGAQNISGMMSLEGTLSEPGFIFPYATTFCLSLLGCNAIMVLMP